MKKFMAFLFAFFLFCHIGISQSITEILIPIKLSENLYAIENSHGGNIAFLVTDEGIVVVDAGSTPGNGKQIVTAIQSVSDKPIKYLVYTHLHGDHINGISSFPRDVIIIAQDNLVENFRTITEPSLKNNVENVFPQYINGLVSQMDSISDKTSDEYEKISQQLNMYNAYFQELKKVQVCYPDTTFTEKFEINLGNEKVILEFPGNGHTNDNIIVWFPKHNAIHTGDLIFNGSVPYVIASHGATVKGWISIVDKLYTGKFKYVIPGHGSITNNEAFKIQADYFKNLTEKVKEHKSHGLSLEDIKNKISFNEINLSDEGNQFPVNIEVVYNEL
ncbi:MAG: hypothetical protein A2X13_03395 [Bacteroidetes bacterium GWC2_33_15]|nr:MAG: hypothetical protein A2X10_13010 [Bacteroidetes bacterium GWA2_33_15]OFX51655.1 MAG: hypothetical protein A2X13_03395 [Bacteroidetes bacterium GWC2_33_15]OFX66283.1 MAG: hypothetical protein A2X15_14550 [Bacteroidetes bacterium GWB2_32_14]OFX66955.1 MAG: hypothetical protein A2X14_00555 [Bacteroidetes bacterium GWD2_33_33]HAN17651.1 hypothetical protein [Bacteroidales bacterium]